jgi:Tfp pilus assembly protein PilO
MTIAIAAGTVGYLTLLFSPGMRGIAGLRQELRTKQDYIGQAERLRPVVAQLGEQVNQTAAYNDRWGASVLPASKLAALYGDLNALAKSSGASSTRFEPQQPETLSTMRKLPIRLGLAGSFAEIYEVVAGIEALGSLVWIEEIKIEGSVDPTKDTKAELRLAVFVDNPKKSG